MEVVEDSEDSDRVGGRDDCTEIERVQEMDVEAADALDYQPHDTGNDKGGDDRAEEGEGEDAAEVVKELLLPHAVARVEDYWRQDDKEEEFRVKRDFLLNLRES